MGCRLLSFATKEIGQLSIMTGCWRPIFPVRVIDSALKKFEFLAKYFHYSRDILPIFEEQPIRNHDCLSTDSNVGIEGR